ncbi:MAG: hypothetical protein AABY75_09025, partial [Bacteroidota bacterium]
MRRKQVRLGDYAAFWKSALDVPGTTRTILIRTDRDRSLGDRLAGILLQNGIEVHRLTSPTTLAARPYYTARTERTTFPEGTIVVSLSQPQRRLATALLEPKTSARDTFFYDISAWSLPVAYGLPAYESAAPLPSSSVLLTEPPATEGHVTGGMADVAYLIPWETRNASKVVWHLLLKGYVVHAATRGFTLNGRTYGAGTAVLFKGLNRPELHADLAMEVGIQGVEAVAANTGLSEKGIALGSDRVVPLRTPSIALATDEPTNPSDVGEVWHLLEREYGVPFTMLRAEDLGRAQLSKYDVLVLPDGRAWRTALDSVSIAALRFWVSAGGVLIGIEDAARALTKTSSGLTAGLLLQDTKEDEKSKEEKDREKSLRERRRSLTRFEKEESDRRERIPG